MSMSTGNAPTAGAPTPPQEEQPNGAYASYVPHDLKYHADFEDSLMQPVLNGPSNQDGIRVIPEGSADIPVEGVSVRAQDISIESLPSISEEELPLPLDDPRRQFASPVPGIKLTHPGGYLEGGPGLDPDMDTFAEDFFDRNRHVTTSEDMRAAIQREIDENKELLQERLRARQEAKEKNERIEKELKLMQEEHEMERKVNKRMAESRKAKKEAKERRRAEREGG
ncbi:uncharacterized protein MYCFIDRAFT_75558 [Pseudocercospora fijiensis CIRAD86]|uniref:Uncharacterized protein n=1 Tax=Pseudocercospora fijiensis (strain CIRAD86) TaxID=383855 RepID=N1Q680_PSEFD|nr:uncharacterized protein MYCFIDRAFT_75558 [Pseudocercospora fijiensis CIRAD86]EME87714.1 hypothetical protein MYCFIDRAFT_75558 [Pseudocercospora fijiensis CIRAD86]